MQAMKSTHSGRLERYLGTEKCAELSGLMRGWYGPPIALHGVPGNVFATGDGDFIGECRNGFEMNFMDHAVDLQRRMKRALRRSSSKQQQQLHAGFASLSDLIAEATAGKRQALYFQQIGTTGTSNTSSSLWGVGSLPAAGAAASAAPGGRVPTSATTGGHPALVNAGVGDTLHLVSSVSQATIAGQSLLLYDRIFDVAKTMSSVATEAVTGVPTRYQSITPGDVNYAGGNFLFPEVYANLGAGAHNWTTCTYLDQGGNASTLPSITGISAAVVNRIDIASGMWFAPLEAGDVGIKTLTQMQCSASITGTVNFVMGHPLAWITHPIAAQAVTYDFINTAFNLVRVFDDACLTMLEPIRSTNTATNYTGQFVLVSG